VSQREPTPRLRRLEALGGPKLPEARERVVASIKELADQYASNVASSLRQIAEDRPSITGS
jgi:hypothetical protein